MRALAAADGARAAALLGSVPVHRDSVEAVTAVVRAVGWEAAARAVAEAAQHDASTLHGVGALLRNLAVGPAAMCECAQAYARLLSRHDAKAPAAAWADVRACLDILCMVDRRATLAVLQVVRPVVPFVEQLARSWTWEAVRAPVLDAMARKGADLAACCELMRSPHVQGADCVASVVRHAEDSDAAPGEWVPVLSAVARVGAAAGVNALAAALSRRLHGQARHDFLVALRSADAWRASLSDCLHAAPALRGLIEGCMNEIERSVAHLRAIADPGSFAMAAARFPADAGVQRFLRSGERELSLKLGEGIAHAREFAAQHGGIKPALGYAVSITVCWRTVACVLPSVLRADCHTRAALRCRPLCTRAAG